MKNKQTADISFFLSKIRELPPKIKARWARPSRKEPLTRSARRLVLAQWLDELRGGA